MITSNEEIKIKDEVAKAYKVYLRNFEAGNMKAIEASCSFPLNFDADGEVKLFKISYLVFLFAYFSTSPRKKEYSK